MDLDSLRRALDAEDGAAPPPIDPALIAGSAAYLASDAAAASIAADTYWPKWDGPWWHMLLLFELGAAARIPDRAVEAMVAGLGALPLTIFPIDPADSPPGTDPHRDSSCHCAVGTMWQVLAACGVDVPRAVPWMATWPARYQLADGGANCDADAYRCGEAASSMVATVAIFEALLGGPPSAVEDRAAQCLLDRRLLDGSPTRHNADERIAAEAWPRLTFPRFYFYDVLRGLSALVRWAERRGRALPLAAIGPAIDVIRAQCPDGVARIGRHAHAGRTTLARRADGWHRGDATTFPLLDASGAVGAPSAALTQQWRATRDALRRLIERGQLSA